MALPNDLQSKSEEMTATLNLTAEESTQDISNGSQSIPSRADGKSGKPTKPLHSSMTSLRQTHVKPIPGGGKTSVAIVPQISGMARPEKKAGTKGGKGGPSSERDSVNALLSLGRDLPASESDIALLDASRVSIPGGSDSTQSIILPAPISDQGQPPKKRQKNDMGGASHLGLIAGNFENPPDFWYWLQPGESIGDWDVLCGRGGESNNFIGNKKYRKVVNDRKEAYRSIPLKQRKAKTAFVRSIVQHVNNCGGRFVDLDETTGKYFVVTMEKARKKTSQALRETKELKWLEIEPKKRVTSVNKNVVCPYCKKPGHKTKIAKACLFHHEWLDANTIKGTAEVSASPAGAAVANPAIVGHSTSSQGSEGTNSTSVPGNPVIASTQTHTSPILEKVLTSSNNRESEQQQGCLSTLTQEKTMVPITPAVSGLQVIHESTVPTAAASPELRLKATETSRAHGIPKIPETQALDNSAALTTQVVGGGQADENKSIEV